jgi:hypothetical protein
MMEQAEYAREGVPVAEIKVSLLSSLPSLITLRLV